MSKKDTRIALFSFFVSHKRTLGQILSYNNMVKWLKSPVRGNCMLKTYVKKENKKNEIKKKRVDKNKNVKMSYNFYDKYIAALIESDTT